MNDESRTKEQLLDELVGLRQKIARLERAEVERRQAERILHIQRDLGIALSSTSDLTEAFNQLLEAILQIEEVDCGSVYLVNNLTGELDLMAHRGLSSQFVEQISHHDADSPSAQLVMAGIPFYASYEDALLPQDEVLRREGLRALAVIPVLHEGADGRPAVVASLNLASHTYDEIPASARGVLEAIAAQIGGVTARVRAERALRESDERYRLLVETSPDAITLTDLSGKLIMANQRNAELHGCESVEELLGLDAFALIAPADRQRAAENARRTLETGGIRNVEYTMLRKDGTSFSAELSASLLRDAEGNPAAFIGFVRDITERKRAAQEIKERQMYLEGLFAAAPDAIVTLDSHHRIVEWNPGAERLFGYSREETIGWNIDHLITNPDTIEEATGLTQTVLSGKEVGPLETVRYHKDGSPVNVILAGSPILVDGVLIGLVAVYTDISERKRAEIERDQFLAQIQEQARRIRQIMDTVPEGVLLLDARGQLLLVNPVAERDLVALADAQIGDTLTHLGDRPLAELLIPPPEGLWHEITVDDARHERPLSFVTIARPLETGPEPEGWVLVVRNVTQEREIQQNIRRQERLAAVGQLAAGIAHDFNNIMATIILYAQMLSQAQGLSPRERERLVTINQQAQHATRLIEQILDFSRRAVIERQPLSLLPLLKEQIRLLKRTLPESIEIELAYGPDDYTVNADPTRIQQAIVNLALNARDAMPEGGKLCIGLERIALEPGKPPPLPEMKSATKMTDVEAAASEAQGPEWVQVTVSDTGAGISPDVLPHIYEPFFTTKEPGQGSGLGLAQVHGIVKAHEGHIDVESRVGHGTAFTIYLPALPVHPPEASALVMSAVVKGEEETILVVEDDATTRQALADILELLNYRPLTAANGRDALDVLAQHGDEVALVISDVVMPEMGGIGLLRTMRKQGLTMGIVLLTGHPLEHELEDLQAQGVVDWLSKPVNLERLSAVVARGLKDQATR